MKAISSYLRLDVAPRGLDVAKSWDFIVALLVGFVVGIFRSVLPVSTDTLDVEVVAGYMLTYASIGGGFALSGLSLAVILPNQNLVTELVRTRLQSPSKTAKPIPAARSRNAMTDLIFIFSWTALVHIALVAYSLFLGSLQGQEWIDIEAGNQLARSGVVGVGAFLLAYGLTRFITAILTIAQVGHANVANVVRSTNSEG